MKLLLPLWFFVQKNVGAYLGHGGNNSDSMKQMLLMRTDIFAHTQKRIQQPHDDLSEMESGKEREDEKRRKTSKQPHNVHCFTKFIPNTCTDTHVHAPRHHK